VDDQIQIYPGVGCKVIILKFGMICEFYQNYIYHACSNVLKGIRHKPNEVNVYPEKTDTVLEKLITMLNNINSTSKNVIFEFITKLFFLLIKLKCVISLF